MGQIYSFFRQSSSSKKYAAPASGDTIGKQISDHAKPVNPLQPEIPKKLLPSDYTFSRLKDTLVTKIPGSFPQSCPIIIEDCLGTCLYILCVSSQITVDACLNCTIVLGPSEGSIFLRDCKNCVIITAAQQLRLRNCQNMKISLFSSSEPVIETSKDIKLWTYHLSYRDLQDQFKMAGLHKKPNKWNLVHDFNPSSHPNFDFPKTRWNEPFVGLPPSFVSDVDLDPVFPEYKAE